MASSSFYTSLIPNTTSFCQQKQAIISPRCCLSTSSSSSYTSSSFNPIRIPTKPPPPQVVVSVESEPEPTRSKVLPFRVGHGFDLHRLEPGYPLIIGGIRIPHHRGCQAHSDGDVLLHCVVDAILGALGLPDIGQIFPDTDPKWKGAPSSIFMEEAHLFRHHSEKIYSSREIAS